MILDATYAACNGRSCTEKWKRNCARFNWKSVNDLFTHYPYCLNFEEKTENDILNLIPH